MIKYCLICIFWLWQFSHTFATTLSNITYTGKVVSLEFSGAVSPDIFSLSGEQPRVVIDLPEAILLDDKNTVSSTPKVINGFGDIAQIRLANREKGLRIVLDLLPFAQMLSNEIKRNKIHITFEQKAKTKNTKLLNSNIPKPRIAPNSKKLVIKPIIVIDPGHGGRDPGAIGNNGTFEKSVTTKTSVELKNLLLKEEKYEVILTRSEDEYIDHEKRIRIARERGADLFISIHADSTANKSARGASVYTLADRAKSRSKRLANSQNWILDVNLAAQSEPVSDILVELAQRSTSNQSEKFADILLAELKSSTRLVGNSHRRAGYYVLLAPDVPAVLLEMGFLSNIDDEKLLNSAVHRKKVLKSVVRSVNKYFDE